MPEQGAHSDLSSEYNCDTDHLSLSDSYFEICPNQASTSYPSESFLDLPREVAVTPTYHIRENPHSTKITKFFPVGQKRKIKRKEEKRIEGDIQCQNGTKSETELLGKGLAFCPSAKIDKFSSFVDLNRYIKKLIIHYRCIITLNQYPFFTLHIVREAT